MEIRAGLVLISPYLGLTAALANDNTVLAERLVAIAARPRQQPLSPGPPAPELLPLAIPETSGIPADAKTLVRLSDAVDAALHRQQHPKAQEPA